jgi:cytochrome c-type biogenesis protein CcmF
MTTAVPEHRGAGAAPLVGLAVVTALLWLGLVRLGLAFLGSSLDWTYVAQQSRVDAPWYYRLAGVWGGMEGSLLLFTAIVGVAATVASRRAVPAARWAALGSVGALATINLALASPFGRLDAPARRGFGMNPILEHPAMAVHPPLLYAGLAASAGAAIAAAGAPSPWPAARRWLLATLALLTAAMSLGAAWSYMEQGWGGYWAWDPVENTSLLVWLAALVAVHAGPLAGRRAASAVCVVPWLAAVVGTALVRSGSTPSVHGFAEQPDVGWALLGLSTMTAAAIGLAIARTPGRTAPRTGTGVTRDPRWVIMTLTSIAAAVVTVGTFAPVLIDLVGGRSVAVRGDFFSRTIGPLAAVGLPFLIIRLRRPWGWSSVAHAGAIVLLLGIAASTFDTSETVPIAAGDTQRVAGVDVTNEEVVVGPGARVATEQVTAVVRVDGVQMRPRLVVYPDRGGRLAHVAVHSGPWTDVHAVLVGAGDNGAIIVTIQRRHGMWLVWFGSLVITAAAFACARRPAATHRRPSEAEPLMREPSVVVA